MMTEQHRLTRMMTGWGCGQIGDLQKIECQSIEEALQWASNMPWNGIKPVIHLMEGTHEKNITVPKDELADYKQQWHPSESLPKWDIKIIPT